MVFKNNSYCGEVLKFVDFLHLYAEAESEVLEEVLVTRAFNHLDPSGRNAVWMQVRTVQIVCPD